MFDGPVAREAGLDLVEVSPHETPPVCRIIDWGKHKYDQRKKQKQQQHHEYVLKEVRLRPKTDDNDRKIKMNRAKSFLEHGHKVQFTMLFRGRERSHSDIAFAAFNGPSWVEFIVRAPTPVAEGVDVYHYSKPVHMESRNQIIGLA